MGQKNTKTENTTGSQQVVVDSKPADGNNTAEFKQKPIHKKYKSFNTQYQGVVNKRPGDPDYSWHHHTQEGRKVLSELSDQFYMD